LEKLEARLVSLQRPSEPSNEKSDVGPRYNDFHRPLSQVAGTLDCSYVPAGCAIRVREARPFVLLQL
jgi:hypothetical protein